MATDQSFEGTIRELVDQEGIPGAKVVSPLGGGTFRWYPLDKLQKKASEEFAVGDLVSKLSNPSDLGEILYLHFSADGSKSADILFSDREENDVPCAELKKDDTYQDLPEIE